MVGFVEFALSLIPGPIDLIYMQADFPVSGTHYARLSKLLPMLAMSGETRKLLERWRERRIRTVRTTAFTDRRSQ